MTIPIRKTPEQLNEVLEKLKKLGADKEKIQVVVDAIQSRPNSDLKTEMLDMHLEIIRRIENQIVLVIKLMVKENMTKEENESLWMTYDFGDIYYPMETMLYSTEEFNNILLKVCDKNKDIFCIDLGNKIPRTLDYMYDDMHFNENGAKFVTEEVSLYIKENFPEFE